MTNFAALADRLLTHNLSMKAKYNARNHRWEAVLWRGSVAASGFGSSLIVAVEHALAQVEKFFPAAERAS